MMKHLSDEDGERWSETLNDPIPGVSGRTAAREARIAEQELEQLKQFM